MTRRYRSNRTMSARINRGAGQARYRMEIGLAGLIIYTMFAPITVPLSIWRYFARQRAAAAAEKEARTLNYFGVKEWPDVVQMSTFEMICMYSDVVRRMDAYLENNGAPVHQDVFDKANDFIYELAMYIGTRGDVGEEVAAFCYRKRGFHYDRVRNLAP
ncbi:hypothetical protein [Buttiauxella agrestis]|uniref:hypothetical protein n=1 Tax=Buttiauxella agrestis TaxID=82977 RepID=UPI00156085B9|nr:hypothetical protein [Buttiauxella agrestis]BCG08761.1 hypothetical protein BADSM9389_14200 [Buttiauxella agrestis]